MGGNIKPFFFFLNGTGAAAKLTSCNQPRFFLTYRKKGTYKSGPMQYCKAHLFQVVILAVKSTKKEISQGR